jgi:sec-independent protein translocase protein TatA
MIVVLVIALLIFGPGRIARIGGELGKSIGAFQRELKRGKVDNEMQEVAGEVE